MKRPVAVGKTVKTSGHGVARAARPLRRRRTAARFVQSFWGRLFTIFVLVFAAPGAVGIAQELLSAATGVECCDAGACEDDRGGCCPKSCVHCACCAHLNALPTTAAALPSHAILADLLYITAPVENPYASGYQLAPFRPPAV